MGYMWEFTKKDKEAINALYQHFLPVFPNVDPKCLYDRIFVGYCWGEGGLRILEIENWERVFGINKSGGIGFSVFDSWDDYIEYNGDVFKKIQSKHPL